jgi:prepilin-type processing-associated H-X9-DG protein
LIEILVVMLIVATLLAILYPTLSSALEKGRITQDASNLRQIALATQTYLNDNDGILPAAITWPGTTATQVLFPKYVATRKVFQSPFDKRTPAESNTAPVSYGFNANMYAASQGVAGDMLRVVSPSLTILMAPNYNGDPRNTSSWTGTTTSAPNLTPGGAAGNTRGTQNNGQRINVLFCDLHTESITFGPSTVTGSFQDTTSDPVGKKHWDPTQ